MAEEFININKANQQDKNYIQVMNDFYKNESVAKINFYNFYSYYLYELKKKYMMFLLNVKL